jgi:glycosyltransferase involved in cell wall biosynthesis
MKIFCNRKPYYNCSWGGGNEFLKNFYLFCNSNDIVITNKLENDIDVIFMMDHRYDELQISCKEIYEHKKKYNTKIVYRANECDARKNTNNVDQILQECSKFIDITIFVSYWLQDYFFNKKWYCCENYMIYNGVDKDVFRKTQKKWTKNRIVTHHWSDNFLKGAEVYQWLDSFTGKNSEYEFTYIGRHNNNFKNTTIIQPLYGKELGNVLSENDIYITGTKYDPGPNHVIEAISCGLPIYVHKNGGGAVEFVDKNCVYNNFEELEEILINKKWNTTKQKFTDWVSCIEAYLEIIMK